jgi:hypothetical protein
VKSRLTNAREIAPQQNYLDSNSACSKVGFTNTGG